MEASIIDINDIISVEVIEKQTVYDIEVENNSNFYLATNSGNPILVHNSGKTELILELLLNLSVLKGWKHAIYLGENGEVEEIIAELAFKYIGKPYKSKSGYAMSESERVQAEMFIDEHFVFFDDSTEYTLQSFYDEVQKAEDEYRIKFDTTLFDPFNDLVDESLKYGGTHHWLNETLKFARKSSKKHNRVDILINHIADIATSIDKTTQKAYLRPALPNEWNGGRTWWRRAFLMLLIYIPPEWLNDENGVPYGKNVTLIYIQKAKPKGVAQVNKVIKLFWDWKINRYWWSDEYRNTKLAFEINKKEEKTNLTSNLDFDNEVPF